MDSSARDFLPIIPIKEYLSMFVLSCAYLQIYYDRYFVRIRLCLPMLSDVLRLSTQSAVTVSTMIISDMNGSLILITVLLSRESGEPSGFEAVRISLPDYFLPQPGRATMQRLGNIY